MKRFLILLAVAAASAVSGAAQCDTLRLLCIGNSFSLDAVDQNLHDIALADGKVFIIGNMYIGGCTLERHHKNMTEDLPAYRYDKVSADGKLIYTRNFRLSDAFADEKWDAVTLQQQSIRAALPETFEPYLEELVSYIKANTGDNVRLMWHQTWAYAKNSCNKQFAEKFDRSQKRMYEDIMAASRMVCEKYGFEVIPCGTAVQNLRTSAERENLTRDGYHLSLTVGRYTAAATFYEVLSRGRSVVGNSYRPAALAAFRLPSAQNAAHFAVLNPYEVTDMDALGFGVAQPVYDEKDVPSYTLPDALTCSDGTVVRNKKTWVEKRRPELLSLFETEMFGKAPGTFPGMHSRVLNIDNNALGGKAVRKEVAVYFTEDEKKDYMTLLMYLPKATKGKPAVFLAMNFNGNWGISDDELISKPKSLNAFSKRYGMVENMERGVSSPRWPLEKIIREGYGVVTFYRGDIDPDFDDGWRNGIQHLAFEKKQRFPKDDEWGTIAAWSWALQRAVDYLQEDGDVDGKRIAVLGHSRLGKAALWAGACDERIAMVISNESGCGGAAISRRRYGETIDTICRHFPHWFCANFFKYMNNEDALPFDQHELLALVCPRPLYVASAMDDRWSDPKGEELALTEARKVYELWGKDAVQKTGYHIREGKHDITAEDWEHYLAFADRYLKK